MPLHSDWLARLGSGTPIVDLCEQARITRAEFDAAWSAECRRRLLPSLPAKARITRDKRGVPHISADTDADLFFGFGYASAQDRLFQLDYLRRKAAGQLAEVLGPEALDSDRLHRTIGLRAIAEREWETLSEETRTLLTAYAAGVNAVIDASRAAPPIEFDLLGYRPEPWSPLDCLLIECEFRWYLTGRFQVIAIPELVKRAVGDGPLFREFTTGEADDASILQPGDYTPGPVRVASGGASGDGPGSNNWVLAGHRTTTGKPIVASDPHVPYAAVSIWYEVVLTGGSFRVAGASLAGLPAVMVGRTDRVAWGITNNICSLRDLYQEKTDAAHPGCFLFDGQWEPAKERQEVIRVRGQEPVTIAVRSSRNGPIVDDVMPAATRSTGPVSVRWQGFEPCGWLPAMLAMNRAKTAAEFRAAGEPWGVPTFNLVYADVDGHIGFQTVGHLPLRTHPERGYRPGWDPRHQWQGVIPYAELPHLADPPRGHIATANNRVAPDDFPQPLSGCWSGGYRCQRAYELLEAKAKHAPDDSRTMHQDLHTGRAVEALPALLKVLEPGPLVERLRTWDCRMSPDSVAAGLFHLFFHHWCRTVAAERLPADQAEFVAPLAGGIAGRLLHTDAQGWFHRSDRIAAIRSAFRAAIDDLTARFGSDASGWTYGRLHPLNQKHFLSTRGDLGQLLDLPSHPIGGDGNTLFAGSPGPDHASAVGPGYRMIADLSDPSAGLWAIEVAGVSGQSGSPHYADQLAPWLAGEYFHTPLR